MGADEVPVGKIPLLLRLDCRANEGVSKRVVNPDGPSRPEIRNQLLELLVEPLLVGKDVDRRVPLDKGGRVVGRVFTNRKSFCVSSSSMSSDRCEDITVERLNIGD
jgi:hypothetical protein